MCIIHVTVVLWDLCDNIGLNVLPVYCCFTRTTLKSMCIQSFILIGYCVSELNGHICLYRNVLPIVVLQELQC